MNKLQNIKYSCSVKWKFTPDGGVNLWAIDQITNYSLAYYHNIIWNL